MGFKSDVQESFRARECTEVFKINFESDCFNQLLSEQR